MLALHRTVHIIGSNGREPTRRDPQVPAGVKCRRSLIELVVGGMPTKLPLSDAETRLPQTLIFVVPAYRMRAC